MSVVYIVHGAEGTCPSDAHEWVAGVFASRADADAYAATHSAGENVHGGPWYTVQEHTVHETNVSQTDAMTS